MVSLEVLEVDILRSRWVARIGVTGSTEACFLTADRQCTELPLLRLPRLVPSFAGVWPHAMAVPGGRRRVVLVASAAAGGKAWGAGL